MKKTVVALSMMTAIWGAHAADLEREARISEQVADAVMDGEVIHLEAEGHRFFAIAMPPEGAPARGAALILHGRGLHPDWETVVYPLRTGLARQGWYTLAIQLPVLEKDASYYDYLPVLPEAAPRIEAALAHLAQAGFPKPVIVAHSCGVHMAMHWLEGEGRETHIRAFVGVGMGATDAGQPMPRPFPLDRLRIPVLDILGSDDYPSVKAGAAQRREAILKAGNAYSRQHVLAGADHYARRHGDALVEVVADWLDRLPR
ncbi:MAG: DUF3530 family protein [Thiohalomonadaceae bacterium]